MIKREIVTEVIGKTFADHLDEPIIDIGHYMNFSRRDMVEKLGCANFIAAIRLGKVMSKLGITSPLSLHRMDPYSLARVKGIGEAAMFVAMCILDYNNYNVEKWWAFDQTKERNVKFSTFKHHAINRAKKNKQVM